MLKRTWLIALALASLAACAENQGPGPQAPSPDLSKTEEKTVPAGSGESAIVPGTKTDTPGGTTEVIAPPSEGDPPPPAPPPPAPPSPPPAPGTGDSAILLKHPCLEHSELCMPLKKLPDLTPPVNPEVKTLGEVASPKTVVAPGAVESHTVK